MTDQGRVHPQGRIADHVRNVGETKVCTSVVVAAEVRYGAMKKGSQRLSDQVEVMLGALDVVPTEVPVVPSMDGSAPISNRQARRSAPTIC